MSATQTATMTQTHTHSHSQQRKAFSHSTKLHHVQRHDSFSGPDLKVFVKDVSDPYSKKRPITVKTWSTVKDVKDVIQKMLSIPPSLQRLYYGPFMTSGVSLRNNRTLHDAGIYKNGQVLYLEIKGLPSSAPAPATTSSSLTRPKKSHFFDLSTLKHIENDICISKAMFDTTPKLFKSIIKQCRIALAYGIKPVLVLDGSGGTYFLHDINKRKIAVFKPADEEPYAINNPRGYVPTGGCGGINGIDGIGGGNYSFIMNHYNHDDDFFSHQQAEEETNMSMRAGIKPGEACLREVAAYLLDEKGISSVPMTTLVEARHHAFNSNGSMLNLNQGGAAVGAHSLLPPSTKSTSTVSTVLSSTQTSVSSSSSPGAASLSPNRTKKVGSCQEFISSECTMDDISPSKLSIEEVQKIAILDIRILNADRNTANLLCRRNPEHPDTFELIPIDHGYCLRTVADVCWFDWCWLDWPQLKEPLSEKLKEYVLGLDIEKDVRMLRERLDIPKGALDYFRASSKFLKQGVKAGLTLYEIAILCCRNDDAGERPSKLETILSMAGDIAKSAVDNGRWHHAAASRALEEQLSPDNAFLVSRASSKEMNGRSSRRASDGMSIFRSKSSVNFSSFSELSRQEGPISSSSMDCDNGYDFSDPHNKPPTFLEHSSGSESSTDCANEVKEEEEEEREKWAADILADTLDNATIPTSSRRQRAISFVNSDSSDDSSDSDDSSLLSKSPQGFWFVPPSASKTRGSLEDTVWSPEVSPNSSHRQITDDPFALDTDRDRSVTFDKTVLLRPSGLNTELSSLTTGEQDEIIQCNDTERDGDHVEQNNNDIPDSLLRAPMRMKRSQSYSAFSFKRISSDGSTSNSNSGRANQSTTSSEEYEKYYQKFIDLLFDRETTHIKRT